MDRHFQKFKLKQQNKSCRYKVKRVRDNFNLVANVTKKVVNLKILLQKPSRKKRATTYTNEVLVKNTVM